MKHRIILIFCCLLSGIASFSQDGKTSLSRNSILVGESITLTYSLEIGKNAKVQFNPEHSIIPSHRKAKNGTLTTEISSDVEVLGAFKDSLVKNKNNSTWIGTYQITAWDSGSFVLAATNIVIDDSTYTFPTVVLHVDLVKSVQGQDIYDIKESFAEIPDEPFSVIRFTKKNWWWLVLVLLSVIGFLVYKIIQKQNKPIERYKVLSLKDRTLLAIDSLEKEKLWEKNKLKEHFIELSFILRSYLSSRYEINLLEKTTQESKLLFKQLGLHDETIAVIIRILSESDMVKFAKSHPEEIEVLKISQFARQVVAETSPIEFENA
jgi:hypothetical protein